MGYVKFTATLKSGAPRATTIRNGARIYFDQNPPVFTNLAAFQRVDCRHFTQFQADKNTLCGNAENSIPLPNYGVNQQYQWFWDNVLVSTEDTARFYIAQAGPHQLRLAVTNRLCTVDTVATINLTNSVPLLELNVSDEITTCHPFTLSSTINCSWNDGVNTVYGPEFIVSTPGLNTVWVSAANGKCIARDTVRVNQLDFSNYPLIFPVGDTAVVCPGEQLELHSRIWQNVRWYIDTSNGSILIEGNNPLVLTGDTLQGARWVFLEADTLNCKVQDYVLVDFIAQPAILQLPGSLATKDGKPAAWFYAANASAPFDSVAYGAVIANPSNGYYFIRVLTETCDTYSDTLLVQITGLTETAASNTRAWFDFGHAELHVEGALAPGARFRVYDLTGRLVLDDRLAARQSLGQLPGGTYFIQVIDSRKIYTIPAVVQRQ